MGRSFHQLVTSLSGLKVNGLSGSRSSSWPSSQISAPTLHQTSIHRCAYLEHIKDLDAVALCLASNNDIVLIPSDLTPYRRRGCTRLRETTEVHKLPLLGKFGESCAVSLRHYDELAAVLTRPSPRRGSLAGLATQVGMVDEVIEVDLRESPGQEQTAAGDAGIHTLLQRKVFKASPGTTSAVPLVQRMAPIPPRLVYCSESMEPLLV